MKITLEIKGKKYDVQLSESEIESGTFKVTVDGQQFDVRVKEDRSMQERPAPRENPVVKTANGPKQTPAPVSETAAGSSDGSVTAPMPGTIVATLASGGEVVKKGKEIITMETMKMNVPIFAPRDGKLKSVLVSEGDSVKAGQLLAEYE